MILAVPILIAVTLFLGWALVSLTLNAFPLFSGVSAGLLILGWGGSIAAALLIGLSVGLAVAIMGRIAFSRARSPMARLSVGLAFVAPAAFAAHHAVTGLFGHVVGVGPREILALGAAFLVGSAAWRHLIEADRVLAER
jgi:hypothetical protein